MTCDCPLLQNDVPITTQVVLKAFAEAGLVQRGACAPQSNRCFMWPWSPIRSSRWWAP